MNYKIFKRKLCQIILNYILLYKNYEIIESKRIKT